MANREIEIQVKIENSKPLLEYLESKAILKSEKRQVDEYFTPPDRDFTAKRPIKEWLRLRDSEGCSSMNYKSFHFDKDGKSSYRDEYETEIKDIKQVKNIFASLGFKSLVVVEKVRQSWDYQDYEVSLDSVKDLGDFVEIEYKGENDTNPKKITEEMIKFLKSQNVGRIERNHVGYPFQLLFPGEVEWERVKS